METEQINIERELGEIHARLAAIDGILEKSNFEIAMESLNKAVNLEDRFERHLKKIDDSMEKLDLRFEKLEDKISMILEKNSDLKVKVAEQEGKFIRLMVSSFLGGSIPLGVLELIKFFK